MLALSPFKKSIQDGILRVGGLLDNVQTSLDKIPDEGAELKTRMKEFKQAVGKPPGDVSTAKKEAFKVVSEQFSRDGKMVKIFNSKVDSMKADLKEKVIDQAKYDQSLTSILSQALNQSAGPLQQ